MKRKIMMAVTAGMVFAAATPGFAMITDSDEMNKRMIQENQDRIEQSIDPIAGVIGGDEPVFKIMAIDGVEGEIPEEFMRITAVTDGNEQMEVAEDMVTLTGAAESGIAEELYTTTVAEEKKGLFGRIADFFQNIFHWIIG
ncbi:hypothetical protein BHU72_13080 [Desulfuribacillus stibiiarsenatis]|uniref:Uncharacterized protein n=1 Tax=Desulfuribacillus stibiiarsenatis TaxID=1390249 RepID=A0A1E5L8Q5_9FIRM|nr:hypothetical protein [Desulfuribacillus stibiiarsenatis]OEH86537.1 hypothetical protein BHU72_13080 [Desulfuribacillus stibiiarsenatis]